MNKALAPRPDFFLVGAPRCGTTSLDRYLSAHPQIFMSPVKEIHYFGTDLQHRSHRRVEERDYFDLFASAQGSRRVGETSTMYLYSHLAASEIHEFAPDADIIAMLRNPVDAMFSLHSQLLFIADEDEEDFCTALALEPSRMCGLEIPPLTSIVDSLFYRSIYRYTEQLERYYDNFGEDHVHVVLFDDFSDDTAGVYRRVLNFLGVDTAFQPAFRHFNAGRAPRTRVLDRLIKNPPDWFVRGLRKVMPFETRMKVLNLFYRLNAKQKSNHLPEPLRTRLIREFRPEVEALGELIGRDLSHWSNIP